MKISNIIIVNSKLPLRKNVSGIVLLNKKNNDAAIPRIREGLYLLLKIFHSSIVPIIANKAIIE